MSFNTDIQDVINQPWLSFTTAINDSPQVWSMRRKESQECKTRSRTSATRYFKKEYLHGVKEKDAQVKVSVEKTLRQFKKFPNR